MAYKHKTLKCTVDGCDEPVHCLDVCFACYQRMRYWQNRSMKDKANHAKRMRRCQASLQLQMGNVRSITSAQKTRKRKTA